MAWLASTALLIIFAGILLGVAFDAGTRALGRVIGLSHGLRLALVVILFAAIVLGLLAWGGATLVLQLDQLTSAIRDQIRWLTERFPGFAASGDPGDRGGIAGLLPDVRTMLGGATNAIFSLFGAVGNLLVILFLGLFLAAEPSTYKAGFLSLVPKNRRERLSEVLARAARAMRGWLLGQSISMAVIFTVTYLLLALIGMAYPLLLALQAGLLVFIPTLGPAVAGIVIVLAGLAQGTHMALLGLGVYVLIQLLESNLLTPVVQEHTVRLPPAFTLAFQLLMGALFGVLGIALAVPLAAALKAIVEELYVKDALGGPWTGDS